MARCARFFVREVAVQPDGLDDLVADRVKGAKGGHRLLEDQRDLPAADAAHLSAIGFEPGQVDLVGLAVPVLATQPNRTFLDAPILFNDAQDRAGGDALAAAAFADDAKRLAGIDIEASAIDGAHDAFILMIIRA